MAGTFLRALVVALLAFGRAAAADLAVAVVDDSGKPVPNAVVTLMPKGGSSPAGSPPAARTIDQHDEMFDPLVTVVPVGGSVTFTNSDKTQHHVYSFAPIKQFQFLLKPGDRSASLTFEHPGVVAIGCNIHDQMVTYVFVADTPLWVLTDRNGQGVLANIAEGLYQARAWHPDLKPGARPPVADVQVAAGVKLRMTVAVVPRPSAGMHDMRNY